MPRPSRLDALVTRLTELLAERGLEAPREQLAADLRRRVNALALQMRIQPATALGYFDDDALRELADGVVQELAGERPEAGTSPLARERTASVTVAQAGRMAWSLLLVTQAAVASGDANTADLSVKAAVGLAMALSDLPDGLSPVPIAPEVLAYVARVLKDGATRVRTGLIALPPEEDLPAAVVATEMLKDAVVAAELARG